MAPTRPPDANAEIRTHVPLYQEERNEEREGGEEEFRSDEAEEGVPQYGEGCVRSVRVGGERRGEQDGEKVMKLISTRGRDTEGKSEASRHLFT